MSHLSLQKQTTGDIEAICQRVTEFIKEAGFGVLTRIDFDQKIKEKVGETIPRTIILGACNPKLAFEAYTQTTDMALLVPCNIVVRELADKKIMVEAIRPSAMLNFLPEVKLAEKAQAIEEALEKAIARI